MKKKAISFTKKELTALETVFDQLCCDHFRDQKGKTPYDFRDVEDQFVNILNKVSEG